MASDWEVAVIEWVSKTIAGAFEYDDNTNQLTPLLYLNFESVEEFDRNEIHIKQIITKGLSYECHLIIDHLKLLRSDKLEINEEDVVNLEVVYNNIQLKINRLFLRLKKETYGDQVTFIASPQLGPSLLSSGNQSSITSGFKFN